MNNSIGDSRSPLGLVPRQPYADRLVGMVRLGCMKIMLRHF
jgi:hypothetical protein